MASDDSTYIASAEPGPGAPVLLLHAWWGLNQTIKDLADRLAGDGFTVVAPDLFEGRVLTTIEEAKAHGEEMDSQGEKIFERARAGLDELVARGDIRGGGVGIVAVSFGAWYAAQLAKARAEVKALVLVYGGIFPPPENVAYLGHFAEDDQFDDSSDVPGLQQALGDRGEAHVYPGTKHWFFESDRPEYDAEAADLAYARTVELLRRELG